MSSRSDLHVDHRCGRVQGTVWQLSFSAHPVVAVVVVVWLYDEQLHRGNPSEVSWLSDRRRCVCRSLAQDWGACEAGCRVCGRAREAVATRSTLRWKDVASEAWIEAQHSPSSWWVPDPKQIMSSKISTCTKISLTAMIWNTVPKVTETIIAWSV